MSSNSPVLNVSRLLLLLSAVVLVLLLLPPFVSLEWRYLIMTAFSSVCHQLPERSFHIAETSLAVCHRCSGIYAGIPLAMTGMLMATGGRISDAKNVWGIVLIVSLGIMGLDWGLSEVGLLENTMHSRVTTGLLFGIGAGAYLAIVVKPRRKSGSVENPQDNFVL